MIKNYFKIAIAVLRRRKFFTFISLFGISLTLTIVIILAAFSDHLVSSGYPDTNRDKELFVNMVRQQSSKGGFNRSGPASVFFLEHYVSKLTTLSRLGISSIFIPTNTYINNKKLVINLKYTNDQFWNVLQFSFTEGKPYNKQQIDNGEKVTVITEDTRNDYFGEGAKAVGKYIETDNVQYRVIGVVKSVPVTRVFVYADIFVPYTLAKNNDIHNESLNGNYTAILMVNSVSDIPKLKEEYNQMAAKIKTNDKDFDLLFTFADTYLESYLRLMPFSKSGNSGLAIFITILGTFFFLFLLLPTLNLVNINISRIMERSSEIGVRKAFGASSNTLVLQFVVENMILTMLGCLIGITLSFIIIQVVNYTGLIANLHLAINFTVLSFSLVACIIFGLLSGVYPAWRMSRMQVVNALKAG